MNDGLPHKVWIRHFNAMMETGTFNPDIWEYLSSEQKFAINEVKKYFKRVEYRERNEGDDPDAPGTA